MVLGAPHLAHCLFVVYVRTSALYQSLLYGAGVSDAHDDRATRKPIGRIHMVHGNLRRNSSFFVHLTMRLASTSIRVVMR